MIRLEIKNCNMILTEAAKISVLSSWKMDKYKYLSGEEMLPPDQSRVTDQAKFPYFPLGKPFEKQSKTIEDEGEKHGKQLIKCSGEKRFFRTFKIKRTFCDKLVNERMFEINKASEGIDFNNLNEY